MNAFTLRAIDRHATDGVRWASLYRDDYAFGNSATWRRIPVFELPETHQYIGARFSESLQPISEPGAGVWPAVFTMAEADADTLLLLIGEEKCL